MSPRQSFAGTCAPWPCPGSPRDEAASARGAGGRAQRGDPGPTPPAPQTPGAHPAPDAGRGASGPPAPTWGPGPGRASRTPCREGGEGAPRSAGTAGSAQGAEASSRDRSACPSAGPRAREAERWAGPKG